MIAYRPINDIRKTIPIIVVQNIEKIHRTLVNSVAGVKGEYTFAEFKNVFDNDHDDGNTARDVSSDYKSILHYAIHSESTPDNSDDEHEMCHDETNDVPISNSPIDEVSYADDRATSRSDDESSVKSTYDLESELSECENIEYLYCIGVIMLYIYNAVNKHEWVDETLQNSEKISKHLNIIVDSIATGRDQLISCNIITVSFMKDVIKYYKLALIHQKIRFENPIEWILKYGKMCTGDNSVLNDTVVSNAEFIDQELFSKIVCEYNKVDNILDVHKRFSFRALRIFQKGYLASFKDPETGLKVTESPIHCFTRVVLNQHNVNVGSVDGGLVDGDRDGCDSRSECVRKYTTEVANAVARLAAGDIMYSTPTLYYLGTPIKQGASCFLICIGDKGKCTKAQLEEKLREIAVTSATSGGMGVSVNNISEEDFKDVVTRLNNDMKYVSSKKRKGSMAITIEAHNWNIIEFIRSAQILHMNGDENENVCNSIFRQVIFSRSFALATMKGYVALNKNESCVDSLVEGGEYPKRSVKDGECSEQFAGGEWYLFKPSDSWIWADEIEGGVNSPNAMIDDESDNSERRKIWLSETWGEEYDKVYNRLVEIALSNGVLCTNDSSINISANNGEIGSGNDNSGNVRHIHYQRIQAIDLLKEIFYTQAISGGPYLMCKDHMNINNPMTPIKGTVNFSNLCAEIVEYARHDTTAVCNLAAINLNNHVDEYGVVDYEKLGKSVDTVVRGADACISINESPISLCPDIAGDLDPNVHNKMNNTLRPIAVGVMGLASIFEKMRVSADSDVAIELNNRIFTALDFFSTRTSCDLAREKGAAEGYEKTQMFSSGKILFQHEVAMESQKKYNKEFEDVYEPLIRNSGLKEVIFGAAESADPSKLNSNLQVFKRETKPVFFNSVVGVNGNNDVNNNGNDTADGITSDEIEKLREDLRNHGVRNIMRLSVQPTKSTSHLNDVSEQVEAAISLLYRQETGNGNFNVINSNVICDLNKGIRAGIFTNKEFMTVYKHLCDPVNSGVLNIKVLTKELYEDSNKNEQFVKILEGIDRVHPGIFRMRQSKLTRMSGDRQIYITQSQSKNEYIRLSKVETEDRSVNINYRYALFLHDFFNNLITVNYYVENETPQTSARNFTKTAGNKECTFCT